MGGIDTQTIVSASKKKCRPNETLDSCETVASRPRKTHTMTPQQKQAQWETSGMLFKMQLEDPTRYQRVHMLNLDKVPALE